MGQQAMCHVENDFNCSPHDCKSRTCSEAQACADSCGSMHDVWDPRRRMSSWSEEVIEPEFEFDCDLKRAKSAHECQFCQGSGCKQCDGIGWKGMNSAGRAPSAVGIIRHSPEKRKMLAVRTTLGAAEDRSRSPLMDGLTEDGLEHSLMPSPRGAHHQAFRPMQPCQGLQGSPRPAPRGTPPQGSPASSPPISPRQITQSSTSGGARPGRSSGRRRGTGASQGQGGSSSAAYSESTLNSPARGSAGSSLAGSDAPTPNSRQSRSPAELAQLLQRRAAANGAAMASVDADGLFQLSFMLARGKRIGAQFLVLGDKQGCLMASHVELGRQLSVQASGAPGLFPGDIVVQAAELKTDNPALIARRMKAAAEHGGSLELRVRPRPPTFEALLSRPSASSPSRDTTLGLSVAIEDAEPDVIQVVGLRESGLAPAWNDAHGPPCIMPGDKIVEVNGVNGVAHNMLNHISSASSNGEDLRFTIAAPPREFRYQMPAGQEEPTLAPQASASHRAPSPLGAGGRAQSPVSPSPAGSGNLSLSAGSRVKATVAQQQHRPRLRLASTAEDASSQGSGGSPRHSPVGAGGGGSPRHSQGSGRSPRHSLVGAGTGTPGEARLEGVSEQQLGPSHTLLSSSPAVGAGAKMLRAEDGQQLGRRQQFGQHGHPSDAGFTHGHRPGAAIASTHKDTGSHVAAAT